MTLDEIWRELASARADPGEGLLKRRLYPAGGLDLFAAVKRPSNQRVLIMKLNAPSLRQEDLPACHGLELRLLTASAESEAVALEVSLSDDSLGDIFLALCGDLVTAVGPLTDPGVASAGLVARLERWQRFLERTGPEGLGPEHQRGLYGELCLLRSDLVPAVGPEKAITAWRAPTLSNHDFELPGLALEAKTSAGKAHQKLQIASERQLEKAEGQRLLVYFVSLDVQQSTGESLNDAVRGVRNLLQSSPAARTEFEQKLFEWGYLEAHEAKYQNPLYRIRATSYFDVDSTFPRILGSDLRPGVGDVRYSISVSECGHHIVSSGVVTDMLKGAARAC